ncbi:hypothetical protein H257_04340 [Aphanomyces astaci]|uniref:RNase III domain-containing protein n=1 Tax=Aphanomyces astaci TaxID=112090 RepID=W4GWG7_APHAT|nr:hypothetical protein H257_04340 [Aphanomyces astaci]ETV83661.1 hypothetical protein H257_04340 [Aphanomyces astaci]|eukprot:XP_009827091.1 hypothetical protein H257_04340 [Aphanomyces astaci]
MPMDHALVLDWNCSTVDCLLMKWICDACLQATSRTTIVADQQSYAFDGFYLLSHHSFSRPPPFEYVRDNVKCTVTFERVALPVELVGPNVRLRISSFQDYLLWQLLRIPCSQLFPSDSTPEECAPFHIYPRFVATEDVSSLQDVQRLGFLTGTLLSIDVIMDYLDASAMCSAEMFLAEYPPESLLHHVVAYEDGVNHVGCFRVDIVTPQRQLLHDGVGAKWMDGLGATSRFQKWQKLAPVVHESPEVASMMKVLHPNVSYLTGLKCDVFEMASAMPIVFRFLRHVVQLDAFEARWHLTFADKSLLRQAFTHASYVDCGVQSAGGAAESVLGRVQMGHTFSTSNDLPQMPTTTTYSSLQATSLGVGNDDLAAGSARYSHYLCSYDRLAFVGDAVLSFVVSSNSFFQFPDVSETHLRDLRAKIVNNDTVGDLAKTCHVHDLILTSFSLAAVDESTSTIVAADCVKAILGAILYDQGWTDGVVTARAFLRQLFVVYDSELADFMFLLSHDVAAKVGVVVDCHRHSLATHPKASQEVSRHEQFLALCPTIPIDRTHLWLQAMTHKSFQGLAVSSDEYVLGKVDGNYERLEFLGESILHVVTCRVLMDMLPFHEGPLLSTVRASLVSTSRLAAVGTSLNCSPFIRFRGHDDDGNMPPVIADVFQACLGAMYLEQLDLHAIEQFLHKCLFPLVSDAAVANRAVLGPKQRFLDHVRQWPDKTLVSFDDLDPPGGVHMHAVGLSVDGFLVCRAMAPTKEIAANQAALKALQLFGL